ncbi:MAG: 1,4-alpha-glucan branching protein GlgB, partial [Bacteroidota bacterium]
MAKAKSTSTKSTSKSATTKKATTAKAKATAKSKTATAKKVTATKAKASSASKAKATKPKSTAKPRAAAKSTAKGDDFFSLLTDFDIHLFKSGKHYNLYEKLGAHEVKVKNKKGTFFAVWAPNAKSVSVIGNFNSWDNQATPLFPRWDGSGIWENFVPGVGHGEVYKYAIETQSGHWLEKGDPFGTYWEEPPKTASVVWNPDYKWKDKKCTFY